MGAFMLFPQGTKLNIEKARDLMRDKGFKDPLEFELGSWMLLLYSKMTYNVPQCYRDGKDGIYAVGTFTYRGLSISDSLSALLKDKLEGKLELSELFGHYTLIFHIHGSIELMGDPTRIKHVFTNQHGIFFSSSLLAVAMICEKLTVNKMAFYEKCLTGIIVSPDTIFNEILTVNHEVAMRITSQSNGIVFFEWPYQMESIEYHTDSRAKSAAIQGRFLTQYLKNWTLITGGGKVDLGLSGGYDSTLLFAALYPIFKEGLHVHTHSTGHIHDHEKKVALDITQSKDLDCRIIHTERFDSMASDPEPLLLENLLFFDGRTSFDMGGFSPTYTADYRKSATEMCALTFSGVGGEAFRNNFSIVGETIKSERFFKDCVFIPYFKTAINNDELYYKVVNFHLDKCEKNLKAKLRGRVDMLVIRRYYSEIMMPEGQGHVLDAYNTVSACVAPFLEKCILNQAYKGLPYLGNYGEYEAAIIKSLDSELARHMSSYGYPFDYIPLKNRVKNYIRARVPGSVWTWFSEYIRGKSKTMSNITYFHGILDRCNWLEEAYARLKSNFPEIGFSDAMKGSSVMANISYIALTLDYIERNK